MSKKIYQQRGTSLEVIVTCRVCKEDCSVDMTYDQYKRLTMFHTGIGQAQIMLADIPSDAREIFISGICPDCWNKMFKEEEA